MTNVFHDLPIQAEDEEVTELLSRKGARIERIVSNGESMPVDAPYDQDRDCR